MNLKEFGKKENERILRNAYSYVYRAFKEGLDCDVNSCIESCKLKGYDISGEVESKLRTKLEKLYKKHGFDPYFEG